MSLFQQCFVAVGWWVWNDDSIILTFSPKTFIQQDAAREKSYVSKHDHGWFSDTQPHLFPTRGSTLGSASLCISITTVFCFRAKCRSLFSHKAQHEALFLSWRQATQKWNHFPLLFIYQKSNRVHACYIPGNTLVPGTQSSRPHGAYV